MSDTDLTAKDIRVITKTPEELLYQEIKDAANSGKFFITKKTLSDEMMDMLGRRGFTIISVTESYPYFPNNDPKEVAYHIREFKKISWAV